MDNPNRTLTIRLMVATAFLMLIALVGALASLGGDDTAAAWGKALLSAPIFGALFVFLYVVWKADLPRLWREFAEQLASWQPESDEESDKTIKRRSGKAKQQRQKQGEAAEDEAVVRSSALPIYRSIASDRHWVRLGASRQQQLTPEEMAAELERLVPLAAQAEEAERKATRTQAALHRLEAQRAEDEAHARATLTQQAEALAAQWTAEVIARWYGVLFGEREVPAPDEAFEGVQVEFAHLREVAAQAEQQGTRLAEVEQTLQTRIDDLASTQQQLNTARQRLEAVREALGLSTEIPLVEGARQRQAELRTLATQLTGAQALQAARDAWQHKAETLEETISALQAEATRLRAAVEEAATWEEVSEEVLTSFWPTVKLEGEAYLASQRRQRRLLQRLRAAGILLIRHRTAVLEADGGGGPYSLDSSPPLPHHEDSPTAFSTEKAEAEEAESTSGEGGAASTVPGTVASTVNRVRSGRQPVRPVRSQENPVRSAEKAVRPRRRPSTGHY